MTLADSTSSGAQNLRDRFIEASAEAVSDLDCEVWRRAAYLDGLAICRRLDSVEDFEIVLAMRDGECKRLQLCATDEEYFGYYWTTEAIGWVATYLCYSAAFSDRNSPGFSPQSRSHPRARATRWQLAKRIGFALVLAASTAMAAVLAGSFL